MKIIMLLASLALVPAAEAKITRIQLEDITDLQQSVGANCRANDGQKIIVTLTTKTEKFTYSYCSEQALSAYMDQVYPSLRDFLAGPATGACQIKTWCDSYNRCQYENGERQTLKHQLVLISNDRNQIDAESYSDIQISSETSCRPLQCR